MGKYSIRELEQLSGIKAHTIRIWEKRHNIIHPQRTDTNIRFYSDEDLKKIINVSLLNQFGFKISRIADMSLDEMNRTVMELSDTHQETDLYIDQLVLAMIDIEEERFEKTLATLILRYGFEKVITEIVYPFLQKIGILWQTQNITPAHEHFISNLIRQKLMVAIDGLPIPPTTCKRMVLFLPEHEMHELGLLFHHYLARKAGYRTYYLGQMVPYQDLKSIVKVHKPHVLITSLTAACPVPVNEYLAMLHGDFPGIHILVSGLQVREYGNKAVYPTLITFDTAQHLQRLL